MQHTFFVSQEPSRPIAKGAFSRVEVHLKRSLAAYKVVALPPIRQNAAPSEAHLTEVVLNAAESLALRTLLERQPRAIPALAAILAKAR